MARRKTRRRRSNAPRARRRTYRRRNYMVPGTVPNRRRRRRTYRARRRAPRRNYYLQNPRRRRRSYRRRNPFARNPRLLGFQLPSLRDSIAAGAGLLVPPIIEGFVSPYLPSILTTNTAGRWATRIGVVAATGALFSKFVGRREGNLALIGGGAWLVTQAVSEFLPGLIPGMSGQPLLGAYASLYRVPARVPAGQTALTYSMPDRLQPSTRF